MQLLLVKEEEKPERGSQCRTVAANIPAYSYYIKTISVRCHEKERITLIYTAAGLTSDFAVPPCRHYTQGVSLDTHNKFLFLYIQSLCFVLYSCFLVDEKKDLLSSFKWSTIWLGCFLGSTLSAAVSAPAVGHLSFFYSPVFSNHFHLYSRRWMSRALIIHVLEIPLKLNLVSFGYIGKNRSSYV